MLQTFRVTCFVNGALRFTFDQPAFSHAEALDAARVVMPNPAIVLHAEHRGAYVLA